jgi:hypothetical protein
VADPIDGGDPRRVERVIGPPHFEDAFVIPETSGAGRARVLLLPGDGGWALPRWVHAARHGRTGRDLDDPFWPAALQRALRRRLGIEATVLHADLCDERDPATGDRYTVFVAEHHSPGWTPPEGARWVGPDELGSLPLADERHRAALASWIAEPGAAGGGRGRRVRRPWRPPWQRPGWFAGAVAWAAARLRRRGIAVTGPAELLGTKVGRALLRLPTDGGAAYLKALPPMYAREPRLLRLLAASFPGAVPDVLAVDARRRWHLTRDHGGVDLGGVGVPAVWERALSAFAELQRALAGRLTDLLAAGCPDLRPAALAAQLEPLLEGADALFVGRPGGLTDAERRDLAALGPRLRAALDRQAVEAPPPSLVHGDFLPANVAVAAGRPVFVDWCEATVSHPFFSPVRFLAAAHARGRAVGEDPALDARLRAAYLEPWTALAPPGRLAEAFGLACALQPLQHALTYRQLLAAAGPAARTWERRTVAAVSLRRLLAQQALLPPG